MLSITSEENITSAYFTEQRKSCVSLLTNSHLDLLVLILVFKPETAVQSTEFEVKSFQIQ